MSFKMVATDMDWTLLDAERRIPPEVFKLFNKITLSGGYVAIVTGRDVESAREVFLENAYEPGRDGYPHAFAAANKIFYLEGTEYVPDREWNAKIEKWWSESQPLAKQIIDEIIPQLEGYKYERTWDCGLGFTNLEDAIQAQKIITQYMRENGISSILLERNGWGIALNDVRLGKGNCLYRITQKMGLRPEEIIAIGDSNNDRTMLDGKIGFFPACPANADEEIMDLVREKSGLIAKKNYGWGVVEVIKQAFWSKT